MLTFHHDELDSTSDQAKRLVPLYPRKPLLVTAKRQSAGRGRSGRTWQSPLGGAWFTLAWPVDRPVECYASIPLLVGWAVLQSIQQLVGTSSRLQIKWPNDVLLGGKKVAGVLCERVVPTGQAGGLEGALIVGVGINGNFEATALNPELRYPATTMLTATGRHVDLHQLIRGCTRQMALSLLAKTHPRLPPGQVRLLESHMAWMNHPVSLRIGKRLVTGICQGLDSTGRLRLLANGQSKSYNAGEISNLCALPAVVLKGPHGMSKRVSLPAATAARSPATGRTRASFVDV